MEKEANLILKFAMDAAAIMLSNGAETSRVEDTIAHIVKSFTNYPVESFVTTTGIITTIEYKDDYILTMVRRINKRSVNLEKVSLVNDLSRRLERKIITLQEAIEELEYINNKKPYSPKVRVLVGGICCAGFSIMLGGYILDTVGAFITGVVLSIFLDIFNKNNFSTFTVNTLGGFVVAVCVLALLKLNIGVYMNIMIISSIMILVPGVGITNALRDILSGDYLSGTSRLLEATLIAVCIAIGVGIVLSTSVYIFNIGEIL